MSGERDSFLNVISISTSTGKSDCQTSAASSAGKLIEGMSLQMMDGIHL